MSAFRAAGAYAPALRDFQHKPWRVIARCAEGARSRVEDLGVDPDHLVPFFETEEGQAFMRTGGKDSDAWPGRLALAVRRCYISDDAVRAEAARTGCTHEEIIASKMPNPGSVMAGDFGEILTFLLQNVLERPAILVGPKKWRLKQDRTKPISHCDVVLFDLPTWPDASPGDRLLCAEVKTKATDSASTPIPSAIADCRKDRTTRLAKTLVWLRERALTENLGTVTLQHLNRFIDALEHPEAERRFRAVVVICHSLVEEELSTLPDDVPAECELHVVSVDELKRSYEAVFEAALVAVPPGVTG